IRAHLADHPAKIIRLKRRHRLPAEPLGNTAIVPVHAYLADVTQAHQRCVLAKWPCQGIDIQHGTTTGTNNSIAFGIHFLALQAWRWWGPIRGLSLGSSGLLSWSVVNTKVEVMGAT